MSGKKQRNKPIRTVEENRARRAAKRNGGQKPTPPAQMSHASSGQAKKKARDGERRLRDEREDS